MVQNSHAKIFYWAYVNNVINNKHKKEESANGESVYIKVSFI